MAGVTGIVKRRVYTGPNPYGFGPRGAVRPSSPVRAYAGDVLSFNAVLVSVARTGSSRSVAPTHRQKGLRFAHMYI